MIEDLSGWRLQGEGCPEAMDFAICIQVWARSGRVAMHGLQDHEGSEGMGKARNWDKTVQIRQR
jgi:hypothetical protein